MKFLTMTNSGCVDICKNMLKSAELVGLNLEDFIILCLDVKAYEDMKHYPNTMLTHEQEHTEYQDWSFDANSNFRKIVKLKWKLIYEEYTNNKNLCWVDTDIVFKQNPLPFIENNDKVLFQCDRPGSLICSGFMVFTKSEECCKMIEECGKNEEEDDQILINNIALKYSASCALLPMDIFPNGHIYYKAGIDKSKVVIVHNNHMVGITTKINAFKNEGLWYI